MDIAGTFAPRGNAQRSRSAQRAGWPPWPVILVIISFIVPGELSVELAELRFPAHRFVFLAVLPFALARLMMRDIARLHAFDIVMVLFAIWQVGIFTYNAGEEGFVFGGSLALEIVGGYIVARAYIRDMETLQATLRVLLYSIVFCAALALLDTITKRYFTHDVLRLLIGGPAMPPVDIRAGLARAASTFDHPIHYGTYCATMLALLWYSERDATRRYIKAAVVAFATLLSLSSAPMLSLGLQSFMLTWEYWTRGVALRAHMTIAVLAGSYIGMSFIVERTPIHMLITGMTFDPWTGLYRLLIWEHGLTNVWASPWTGLGLNDWDRPGWMISSTIDAYWLVLPMRSGIPALLLLALAIVLLGRAVVRRSLRSRDVTRRRLGRGWMISLITLCLLGATVHYWNVAHALLFFFLGMGGALADPLRQKVRKRRTAALHQHPATAGYGALQPA